MPDVKSNQPYLYIGSKLSGFSIPSKGKHRNGKDNPEVPRINGSGRVTGDCQVANPVFSGAQFCEDLGVNWKSCILLKIKKCQL
jgi:hypothetical protein